MYINNWVGCTVAYPLPDEQVFRFDISVNDVLRVTIVQSDGQIVNVSMKIFLFIVEICVCIL